MSSAADNEHAPVSDAAAAASFDPAASAAAVATTAVGSASAGRVLVKRAGDPSARFAEVEVFADDTVTRLAERASRRLDWRASPAYIDLFLVKPAGAEDAFATPTQAQVDAVLLDEGRRLSEGAPLRLAGVAPGAWVVARLTAPSSAAAASRGCECECAARSLGRRVVLLARLCLPRNDPVMTPPPSPLPFPSQLGLRR